MKFRTYFYALLTGLGAALILSAPAHAAVPDTPLARLTDDLRHAPSAVRSELAQIALAELAHAYRQEAALARNERRAGDAGLLRWSRAVDGLAAELDALAAGLRYDSQIDWQIGPDRHLTLRIDGRPISVSGPRPNAQRELERRIQQRFCAINACGVTEFAALGTAPVAEPPLTSGIRPRWHFSQYAGPVCATDDGLEFQFHDPDDLQYKRQVCDRIVAELYRLAAALAQAEAEGLHVDWTWLTLEASVQSDRQRVALNHDGSGLNLSLPTLADMPALVSLARPWLAARARGEAYRLVILNVEGLIAVASR